MKKRYLFIIITIVLIIIFRDSLINLSLPLVVRLEGTNVKLGKEILEKSNLKIISAINLSDAAKKIIEETK